MYTLMLQNYWFFCNQLNQLFIWIAATSSSVLDLCFRSSQQTFSTPCSQKMPKRYPKDAQKVPKDAKKMSKTIKWKKAVIDRTFFTPFSLLSQVDGLPIKAPSHLFRLIKLFIRKKKDHSNAPGLYHTFSQCHYPRRHLDWRYGIFSIHRFICDRVPSTLPSSEGRHHIRLLDIDFSNAIVWGAPSYQIAQSTQVPSQGPAQVILQSVKHSHAPPYK